MRYLKAALILGALMTISAAHAETSLPTNGSFQVAQAVAPVRGQMGSDRDIAHRITQLEKIIADLQGDQSDYGGFKGKAMQDLNAAHQDLISAENWAHAHGE